MNLLDRIPEEKRRKFIVNATDLHDWYKTIDQSVAFIKESLKLSEIKTMLIEDLVELIGHYSVIEYEIRKEYRLSPEEFEYVKSGWFELNELKHENREDEKGYE